MKFKEWFLKEVGTSTASVAVFSRPFFSGAVTRCWPKEKKEKDDRRTRKN